MTPSAETYNKLEGLRAVVVTLNLGIGNSFSHIVQRELYKSLKETLQNLPKTDQILKLALPIKNF